MSLSSVLMPPLVEAVVQAAIALSGVVALVLVLRPESDTCTKWGVLIGLAGQPFWIWTTWAHGQFGMLLCALAYTLVWGRGVWDCWISPRFRP